MVALALVRGLGPVGRQRWLLQFKTSFRVDTMDIGLEAESWLAWVADRNLGKLKFWQFWLFIDKYRLKG